jgi:hypothetical protein
MGQAAPDGMPDWAAALRWDGPWLAHLAPYAAAVSAALQRGHSVARLLNDLAPPAPPVRFVDQSALPPGQAYEAFIHAQRACPTRDNLHDLFNGLTWLAMPRTKSRLNALQAALIALDGVGDRRGPLRDALTLFDENGAILLAPPALVAALRARDWPRLFIELRSLWQDARLLVFGHALQEKLQQPRKAITAHVYLPRSDLAGPGVSGLGLDQALAEDLDTEHLAQKPYCPLPILGVPGWYLPNENFSFYDDAQVFRPAMAAGREPGTA